MRTYVRWFGVMGLAVLLAGCATTKTGKTDDVAQLRSQMLETDGTIRGVNERMNTLEEEMRTLKGLQEGLRQQLETLSQQLQRANTSAPDEK